MQSPPSTHYKEAQQARQEDLSDLLRPGADGQQSPAAPGSLACPKHLSLRLFSALEVVFMFCGRFLDRGERAWELAI